MDTTMMRIFKLGELIIRLREKKNTAVNKQDYQTASDIRDIEIGLEDQIPTMDKLKSLENIINKIE